jgi:hypothetical protein
MDAVVDPAAPLDPVDPAIVADPAPIAAEVVQPELQLETPPQPAPAAAERMIPVKTFQKVIAEVRGEKGEIATELEAARQRAADLQAIIDRMQADPAAPKAAPAAPAPQSQQQPQDFQAAVKAEAAKARLYEDTLAVRSAGQSEFTDFNETLSILTAVGATNDDFVSDLLAVDKAGAHKILDKLAKDPEKAASLVGLDSRRRIAELTRMADAPKSEVKPAAVEPAKPAAPAVSRAPAPKPQLSPLAPAAEIDPTTPDGNDKMDDKAWEAWYKAKYMKRA